mgnify:CR=1 FL=1
MTWFIEHLKTLANKPSIVDQQGNYSYSDLSTQIEAHKKQLDEQLADGQVVVILSDYNFNAVSLFFEKDDYSKNVFVRVPKKWMLDIK